MRMSLPTDLNNKLTFIIEMFKLKQILKLN